MKKRLLLYFVFAISILGNLKAQNWAIFNKDYRYNYSLENETYSTVIIFADSVLTQGTDTIYSLNRIAGKCDFTPDTNCIMINQPQFMQRRIIYSNNEYRFSDTSNYIIPHHSNINDTWVFNASRGISATVISANIKTYFGVTDSIKTILLSTNDTIILSKQFGIIKYPANFNQHKYYKLRGIENKSSFDRIALYGEKVPNEYDFRKLKPGVVHYYSYRSVMYGTGLSNVCNRHVYGRLTVTSCVTNGDTISVSYTDEVKGCYQNCGTAWACTYNPQSFPTSYGITTYSQSSTSIYVSDNSPWLTCNSYNNAVVSNGWGSDTADVIYVVRFGKTPNGHFYKTYGESCFAHHLQSNPLPNFQYSMIYRKSSPGSNVYYGQDDETNIFNVFGETFIEGYGRSNAVFYAFESDDVYCASAIIDGNDTLGNFFTQNIVTALEDEKEFYVSNGYPNPTTNTYYIAFPTEATKEGILELKDITGKILSQKTISHGTSFEIVDLESYAQGIYFVEVKILNFQRSFKVVKQ